MKTRLLNSVLIVTVSLFFQQVDAQHWEQVHSGTDQVWDACFVNATTAYAVGYGGLILKSADAGTTWTTLISGTEEHLYCVHFISETTGFAGGVKVLLKTTDAGETWTDVKQTLPSDIGSRGDLQFYKFYPYTEQELYIVGNNGVIVSTTDEGGTWNNQSRIGDGTFRDISFANATTGFIVKHGGFMHKTEDRITWGAAVAPTTGITNLFAVEFLSETVGLISGQPGCIYKTTNGGNTWTQVYNNAGAAQLLSMCFVDQKTGYVAGSGGVYSTTDGGDSWTKMTATGMNTMRGICFFDKETGLAVGVGAGGAGVNGAIFKIVHVNSSITRDDYQQTSPVLETRVIDLSGKTILQLEGNDDFSPETLSRGIYFVVRRTANGSTVEKMLK